MGKVLIVFAIFFWSCTSCSDGNPANDADKVDSDSLSHSDMDESDSVVDGDDSSDEVLTELDETDDEQTDMDSDTNSDGDCPALKDANFPYYREDGSIHFCRKCDLAAPSDDPDCVRNIWKEKNELYAKDYPERECAGYPCIIEGLEPKPDDAPYFGPPGLSKCDKEINPVDFYAGSWRGLAFGIDDGKIGTVVHSNVSFDKYPIDKRAVEFDIKTEKYKAIMLSSADTIAYNKGNFISFLSDYRQFVDDESLQKVKNYLVYYSKENGYKVISNKTVDFIPYSLVRLSDNYAAVVIKDDGGVYELRYAKVGEWKWQKIEGVFGYNNYIMVEKNILAFFTSDWNVYHCDMEKSPKSLSDCTHLKDYDGTSNDEDVAIDMENPQRIAFSPKDVPRKIVVADMSSGKPDYSEIELELTEENNTNVIVTNFSGNIIIYQEVFQYYYEKTGDTISDVKTCFYRLDKKKKYCSKRISEGHPYYHGRTDFEGKYLVINSLQGGTLILRDMECYCKEESVCPFEE